MELDFKNYPPSFKIRSVDLIKLDTVETVVEFVVDNKHRYWSLLNPKRS